MFQEVKLKTQCLWCGFCSHSVVSEIPNTSNNVKEYSLSLHFKILLPRGTLGVMPGGKKLPSS